MQHQQRQHAQAVPWIGISEQRAPGFYHRQRKADGTQSEQQRSAVRMRSSALHCEEADQERQTMNRVKSWLGEVDSKG